MAQRPVEQAHVGPIEAGALRWCSCGFAVPVHSPFQQARAQRRRQRERHQHRDHDGHGHGPAELVHVAPRVAGHEGDGHKDDDQRKRGGDHRQRDFPGGADGRLHRRHALLVDAAVDVLEHDDGVVDDDAHRQRQPQQRHRIQREVHDPHQGERGDDRGGDGDRADEHRAPVADEQADDDARPAGCRAPGALRAPRPSS